MCIAILSPENVVVPRSHLYQSFQRNSDGAGFMYAENDKLIIKKGFMDFDSFYEEFKPHQEKSAAIHFRITTHGATDEANTHPFQVGPNLGFIHNGVINAVDCSEDKSRSDTYHFNTKFLSQFYKRDSRFIYKEHFKDVIKAYVGQSKLVFLNNKGHHTIVNEKAGVWEEGAWYSNTSFRPYVAMAAPVKPHQQPNLPLSAPKTFAQGTRVKVNHPSLKGTGTIMHFTGGVMVGVLLDGDERTSLLPMDMLEVWVDTFNNPFSPKDWVVRKDNKELVGEVMGTSKQQVWVKWFDDDLETTGPTYVMNADKLEYWSYMTGV